MNLVASALAERPLPIVVVGHVDHGKSTLVGRLLHETGSLPDGKVAELRTQSARRGVDFEWSFVMDALQVERDQNITLDTARIWFSTARRRYVIIDAPGHAEFLKNMVTGAASADAAILVVDAAQGVSEQTRRHAYLLALLGVRQVAVAINKMDLVGHDEARFAAVAAEVRAYLAGIGIEPDAIVPISARGGDNMAAPPAGPMAWWRGPTLVAALDGFVARPDTLDRPLRLPVQDVYREGARRIVVGRIESGRLRAGDAVVLSPGGRTARVAGFEAWGGSIPVSAGAGQSVALTFDEDVFVERGHVLAAAGTAPAEANTLRVRLFWLDEAPLAIGDRLTLRLGTASHTVTLSAIERIVDVADLSHAQADRIERNAVAEVVLHSRSRIVHDAYADLPATGRAALVRDYRLVGGCTVVEAIDSAAARNLTSVVQTVTPPERAAANGHRGGVLWLTGLSGSGKSTLAMALQRHLFERGRQIYVLDGDNVRQGLNRDLGFSPRERTENIRRIAEVARLFADAGFLVATAFISPYRDDREIARGIVGEGFREVYVRAALDVCERRDPKGLYLRARAGEIPDFTGIGAPYEEPLAPDLTIDTEALPLDAALRALASAVEGEFAAAGRERIAG